MKALEGVKIWISRTCSGPTCTGSCWPGFGADVIKVDRPGVGDSHVGQLVDVKGADSLYFTI